MVLNKLLDNLIHPSYFEQPDLLRKARLLIRASFITSLFSNSYIWLSLYFEFPMGVNLMVFNFLGFFSLPWLVRTRLPLNWLGNAYVAIGAIAVMVLPSYSGGLYSAIYPWIIAVPILALLVVGERSGWIWAIIGYLAMQYYAYQAWVGVEFTPQYNEEFKTEWFISVLPGLLLITTLIAYVFKSNHTKALTSLQERNIILQDQKEVIAKQTHVLQSLLDEKKFLIRIMAHDIRNPLANIQGLVELLRTEKDPNNVKRYTQMIEDTSHEANALVKKVLEMDKSEQDDIAVKLVPVKLVKLIRQTTITMTTEASLKSIKIKVDNKLDDLEILTDEIYVKQILENLLSNAIKFSHKGSVVKVVVQQHEGDVLLKVIDEGQGIPQKDQEKLFKKFTRLTPQPTGGESSSGLGLALVKRYAELIRAKIWHEDNPNGVGATFVLAMPVE